MPSGIVGWLEYLGVQISRNLLVRPPRFFSRCVVGCLSIFKRATTTSSFRGRCWGTVCIQSFSTPAHLVTGVSHVAPVVKPQTWVSILSKALLVLHHVVVLHPRIDRSALITFCFCFAVLSVGSSLFTAPNATQGVACEWRVDNRPPEQLKYPRPVHHAHTNIFCCR